MSNVAVVTGASTGIGKALVLELAKRSWRIYALARSTEKIEVFAAEQPQGSIIPTKVDLTDVADIRRVIHDITQQEDSIHLLANIAGVWHNEDESYYGPKIWEIPEGRLLEVMTVGITAPMLLSRGLIPKMPGNGVAQIVNLTGTFNTGAGWLHYYTSKKALENLTLGLADELREKGVRANCVSPADTATEAYSRFYPEDAADGLAPEYVAQFIVELFSPSMQYVNGQIIEIRNG